jgi:hypothetical protein
MNIYEKRHEVLPEYPNTGILALCQGWHEIISGSADGYLHTEELEIAAKFLSVVLETWSRFGIYPHYDNAVQDLVIATLSIIKGELNRRK